MKTSKLLLLIAYLGFISLGLPDAAHGVNWPFVRQSLFVPIGWLGFVIAAGSVGYLLSSFCVGQLLERWGIAWLLILSSLLVSLGLFGFAISQQFYIFCLFATLIGLGSGGIDAGLNAYAAENFSAKHMNWLHAAFGVGATLGPVMVTWVLVHSDQQWRWGYALIGSLIFIMALVFVFSRNIWRTNPSHEPVETAPAEEKGSQWRLLKHPTVRLQMLFFFFYTGLEFGVGQWAFTVMTETRGISLAAAGTWVALFWAALAFGRILFGVLVERFDVDRLLGLCLLGVVAGAVSFSFEQSPVFSFIGLVLIGFCAAPIFPCMISQTANRVGKNHAPHAIGMQMSSAVLGAMTLPFASGIIAEHFGMNYLSLSFVIYAIIIACVFHRIRHSVTKGQVASLPL